MAGHAGVIGGSAATPIPPATYVAHGIVAGVLFDLGSPPRPRLTIGRGSYTKAVVRCFFTSDNGRRSCLDSALMCRSAAVKLAKRIAKDGTEVEVVGFRFNCIRPRPWNVHAVKRLDEHRLNRVAKLISAESMFLTDSREVVTMENEIKEARTQRGGNENDD